MLVLLSGSKRKRYREDVLRCLAAPEGACIQFRYTEEIVEPAIWEKPEKFLNQKAVVCSVDLRVIGKPCPLVPVRCVSVQRISKHGTTMSLELKLGSLAYPSTPSFSK